MELHQLFTIYLCLVLFWFIFPILSFFPAQSNNTYHVLYYILSEIHRHQHFNQCCLLFGFFNNSFITVLVLRILLFLFVIVVCVLLYLQIFYRIVLISAWYIIFISTYSIFTYSIMIICLVQGETKVRVVEGFYIFRDLRYFYPDLEFDPFLV